jgi:hypothetical protein
MEQEDRDLLERSLLAATQGHRGDALDSALVEVGWLDALAFDPRAAVSILFELQGAAGTTSSALERVVGNGLGLVTASRVVLPYLGRHGPPGVLDGGRLSLRGVATAGLSSHGEATVVAASGDKHVCAVVSVSDLAIRRVEGIDPQLGLVEVSARDVDLEAQPGPAPDWPRAVALGRLAVGHELIGASRTMLDLARRHALERIQFGRPIASFQAVRHRLAETLISIEAADGVLAEAWEDPPGTARTAKALAGRAARSASRHCQQVLAGIGFTTEHPLHRYVKRVLVLDELFGGASSLTKELGEDLLASRTLPTPLPL